MDVEQVKNWLDNFRELSRDIDNLCETYQQAEARMTAPHVPRLDGMPHGNGDRGDHIGRGVSYLDELARQIADLQDQERRTRREIDVAVKLIHGPRWPDKRGVIRFRYLLTLTWTDVNVALWGSQPDFLEKEQSYLRRTYLLHKDALLDLSQIIPDPERDEDKNEKEENRA